ncbi:hypothetical protein [Ferrovibrio sp.]|uniref:alpha/beta hydrolase family protein n=1 Tax=Ferrovibrio sp. TaxID=1917215 RepID=UPI00311FF634
MRRAAKVVCVLAAGLALAGCVTKGGGLHSQIVSELEDAVRNDPKEQIRKADAAAASLGYSRFEVKAGRFLLVVRMQDAPHRLAKEPEIVFSGDNVIGYVEDSVGSRHMISPAQSNSDTPASFMDRAVAHRDLVFIERPCFAVTVEQDANCSDDYWWGRGRYSEPVVAALSSAVDWVKEKRKARAVRLLGGSSGGALAMLVAARRTDVISIATLSAVFDFNLMGRFQSSQYRTELSIFVGDSPQLMAQKLKNIQQIHIFGTRDELIPQENWTAFHQAIGDRCSRFIAVEMGHADAVAEARWRQGIYPPPDPCR